MHYKPIPALGKDRLTPFFDGVVAVMGLGTAFKKNVVERAQLRNGERLLDVGCGTATLLLAVKAHTPTIEAIGIDSDARVLALARKKIGESQLTIEVMQAEAERLPFPSDSFDIVTSTLTFHHFPTEIKKQVAREIYRVLKPEGRFVLADFGPPHGILPTLLFALGSLLPSREGKYVQDNTAGKLPMFLEEAGFTVTELVQRHKRMMLFLLASKT